MTLVGYVRAGRPQGRKDREERQRGDTGGRQVDRVENYVLQAAHSIFG